MSEITGTLIDNRYLIESPLRSGSTGDVYRALDKDTGNAIAAKFFRIDSTSRRIDDIIHFHNEINALLKIENPHVIKIHRWGTLTEKFASPLYYILMDLVEGLSLDRVLADKKTLPVEESVDLLVQLCDGILSAHASGIIHSDLKPGNILIDRDNKATIIDFGFAKLKDIWEPAQGESLSGTFMYMSPEQAGLTGHPADERSDLYSMGIIAYEILTGVLPFSADSLVGLLHRQAAQLPTPPTRLNKKVSPALETIIMTLLEKEPPKRYQTARGLLHDLERVKEGDYTFTLRENDDSGQIDFNTPIFGRESELRILHECLDSLESGRSRICLIGGEAGSGKTRLLREFRKSVFSSGVVYIEAFASPGKRLAPYGLFRDGLTRYLRRFAVYPVSKQERITATMRLKFSEPGGIITRFHPPLEIIIGKCPEPVALEPGQERQRLLLTLSRFLIALAEAENGMVMALEDLHWTDEGSLALLNKLYHEMKHSPLCIAATYRNDEIDGSTISTTVTSDDQDTDRIKTIMLPGLSSAEMKALIRSIFPPALDKTDELCLYLFERSKGSPFYALETVKALVHRGIIHRDEDTWILDEPRLYDMEPLPGMIDIILSRIETMSAELRDLLSAAAVIGRRFDIPMLIELKKKECSRKKTKAPGTEEIIALLDTAKALHIIARTTDSDGAPSFVHDRIREAFYEKMDAKDRSRLHQEAARLIESASTPLMGENLFHAATHYIEAGVDDKITEYAYPAALEARRNFDHNGAIRFFRIVLSVLEKQKKTGISLFQRDIVIDCLINMGESLIILEKNREAIQVLSELSSYDTTFRVKVRMFCLFSRAFYNEGDFIFAEKYALRGLALIDETMPQPLVGHFPGNGFSKLSSILKRYNGASARQLEESNDRFSLRIWFYAILYDIHSFRDMKGSDNAARRIIRTACEHKAVPREIALGLSCLGAQKIFLLKYNSARYCIRKAKRIIGEIYDDWARASISMTIGRCHLFMGEFDEADTLLQQAIDHFRKIGDVHEIMLARLYLSLNCYQRSEYSRAWELFQKARTGVSTIFDEIFIHSWGYPALWHIESENFEMADEILSRYLSLLRGLRFPFLYFYNTLLMARLNTEKGDFRQARSFFREAGEFMNEHDVPPFFTSAFYLFRAQFLVAEYSGTRESPDSDEYKSGLKMLGRECRKALSTSKADTRGTALRLMAHYHHIKGNIKKAASFFEKSTRHNNALNKPYELARTLFEYALFLRQNKSHDAAYRHLLESYRIFTEIGLISWTNKISSIIGAGEEREENIRRDLYSKRISHIMEHVSGFAAIQEENELFHAVLQKAMEASGARQGYLFLFDDRNNRLECVASENIDKTTDSEYSINIINTVFETGSAVLSSSAESDNELMRFQSVCLQGLKSVLCVPMQHNDLINGVCWLDNPLSSGIFGDDELKIVELLLSQSVIIIENRLLHRKLKDIENRQEKTDSVIPAVQDGLLEAAIRYIEEHYAEEMTREDIADDLGINPDYLGKLFKSSTGETIRDYANKIKIRKAVAMLDNNEMKIIDIAYTVGFESLRTFNRVFYRVMGTSPKDYRNNR